MLQIHEKNPHHQYQFGIFFFFSGGSINWESLCIVEGILRFLQDVWYILAAFVLIFGDSELGQDFPGKAQTIRLIKRLRPGNNSANESNVRTTFYNAGNTELQEDGSSMSSLPPGPWVYPPQN